MSAEITITRDGTVIRRFSVNEGRPAVVYLDRPSAGTHTYAVQVARTPLGGGVLAGSVGDRTLLVTILKA